MTRTSLWKVAACPPYRSISAMEMDFKCGRTEFEYKAALELRQSPSSPHYQLDHDGSGN